MRGIILAGGSGSRLGLTTKVINKHLITVGDRPMIMWPIQTLKANGIHDITIVSTPRGVGQLAELLGSGYTYRVQDQPGGIPQAIMCGDIKRNENVAVILGDNLFLSPPEITGEFTFHTICNNAHCFLKQIEGPKISEYGVATITIGDGRVNNVVEKPKEPRSNYAVTGFYLFSYDVFYKASKLKPSSRGEYEIADLLNVYAGMGKLGFTIVDGFWGDAGTFDGWSECHRAAGGREIK